MGRGQHKPTKIYALEGKRDRKGRKQIDKLKKEPKPVPLNDLNSPDDIDDIAKECWNYYVKILLPNDLLTVADRRGLANLCQIESYIIQLQEELKDTPFSSPTYTVDPTGQEHMKVKIDERRKELRLLYKTWGDQAGRFGLTPRDRAGLDITVAKAEKEGKGKTR